MSHLLPLLLATLPAPSADAGRVFEQRVRPIADAPGPSSCVRCHLAGVDLKQYLRPTSEQTFRSLRDQGLIDTDTPDRSRLLGLIRRGGADAKAKAEAEALAAWIAAAAADPAHRALPPLPADQQGKPARPVEVIRHARTDRLLDSFTQTVWAVRLRCMSCHTEGSPESAKLVAEHGKRVAWVKAAGPAATLDYLRASKLIDPDKPAESLLLLKPLAAVDHGGGQKFQPGDQGYKAFRAFLEDYAKVARDRYPDAASLPKPDAGPWRFGSDIWLKLTDTPPAWGDKLAQVEVYAWDAAAGRWEADPVATSDRKVWGKGRLWQHNLTLLAAPGSARAKAWAAGTPSLPPGRYLVRVSVDAGDRLAADWTAALAAADRVAELVVQSAWPAGYGTMTAVAAGGARK
jgi:hypothetical protein